MSAIRTLYAQSIISGNTSGNITGQAINTEAFPIIGIQAVWTGTTNGTITLEGSIDGTNYSAIAGVSIAPAGSPGAGIDVPTATYIPDRFVRAVFTRTSGSGVLQVYVSGKN